MEKLGRCHQRLRRADAEYIRVYVPREESHAWRALVVAKPPVELPGLVLTHASPANRLSWSKLLARVFLVDALLFTACGGQRRVIAAIEEGPVARKILEHLVMRRRLAPWTVAGRAMVAWSRSRAALLCGLAWGCQGSVGNAPPRVVEAVAVDGGRTVQRTAQDGGPTREELFKSYFATKAARDQEMRNPWAAPVKCEPPACMTGSAPPSKMREYMRKGEVWPEGVPIPPNTTVLGPDGQPVVPPPDPPRPWRDDPLWPELDAIRPTMEWWPNLLKGGSDMAAGIRRHDLTSGPFAEFMQKHGSKAHDLYMSVIRECVRSDKCLVGNDLLAVVSYGLRDVAVASDRRMLLRFLRKRRHRQLVIGEVASALARIDGVNYFEECARLLQENMLKGRRDPLFRAIVEEFIHAGDSDMGEEIVAHIRRAVARAPDPETRREVERLTQIVRDPGMCVRNEAAMKEDCTYFCLGSQVLASKTAGCSETAPRATVRAEHGCAKEGPCGSFESENRPRLGGMVGPGRCSQPAAVRSVRRNTSQPIWCTGHSGARRVQRQHPRNHRGICPFRR